MMLPEMYVVIIVAISVIAIIISIVSLIMCTKMSNKYKSFMEGKDAQSLENIIMERINELNEIKDIAREHSAQIELLLEKMEYNICKVGLVKYDAFNEMGGKLSFALVMLNERNNGFSMNSMHGQEGSYVYVKEIINGESFIALGDEEQKALKEALDSRVV